MVILCLFHVSLLKSGKTTKEKVKGQDSGKRKYWTRSWVDFRVQVNPVQLYYLQNEAEVELSESHHSD